MAGLSLEKIRGALSAAGDPWEAGVTSVSVLSEAEQDVRLGVTPPPGEPSLEEAIAHAAAIRQQMMSAAMGAITAPAAYDLRDVGGKNYVTAVKDQGNCGSCVAFGTAATVETTLRVQRGDPDLAIDLSEAHLFFCHARARNRNCDNGWWPNQAMEDLQSKGVVDEACYPYDTSKTACNGLCGNADERAIKIVGSTDLTEKPAQIKEWIATKGAVSACFVVYSDFFSYKSGVYRHVSGEQRGGHCVTIVGYNDSPGYWICKNSWTTGFGQEGFFNIAYGECAIDSWQNHGVTGIVNTGWQNNKRVAGLWAINEDRNAWVNIQGLGWKRLSHSSDNVLLTMLTQLVAAKAGGRAVNFYEVNGVIQQIYVF